MSTIGTSDRDCVSQELRRGLLAGAAVLVLGLLGACKSESAAGEEDIGSWQLDGGQRAEIGMSDTGADAFGNDSSPDTTPVAPCPESPTARIAADSPTRGELADKVREGTIVVRPQTKLSLVAYRDVPPEAEGSGARAQWSILESPEDAVATFSSTMLGETVVNAEIVDETNGEQATLTVGLTGRYRVALDFDDEADSSSCNRATLTIDVQPTSEFYVEFRSPLHEYDTGTGRNLKGHCCPWLDFRFKRTASANWYEDSQVIPKRLGNSENDHDWGTPGDSSDDPRIGMLLDTGGSNRHVALDGVESDITYVGAIHVFGETDRLPLTAEARVFLDGKHRKTVETRITEEDLETAIELFRFTKHSGRYEVRDTVSEIADYPQP